jgi:hypothetical protein
MAEASTTVSVTNAPTAAIADVTEPPVGEPVTFDASESSDEEGPIANYAWTIDGEKVADTTEPDYAYSFDCLGSHTVSLEVTDEDGATDTTSETFDVVTRQTRGLVVGTGVGLG